MIYKIKKTKLADEVYDSIKESLFSGIYKEGSLIPSENQLAKMLNVSRVVVRDALQKLRDEKVIVTHQGKGSFLANPKNFEKKIDLSTLDIEEFSNVMEFRACIEQTAIKKAVKTATDKELKVLYDCVNKMEKSKGDLILFTNADYEFHLQILKCAKNSTLINAIEHCKQAIIKVLSAMNSLNDSRDWGLDLHKQIAQAIINRDAKSAINLLNNNGEYNLARMKQLLFNNVKGEKHEDN